MTTKKVVMDKCLSFSKYGALIIAAMTLVSCNTSFNELEFKRGQQAASKKNYEKALRHFKKVAEREPDTNLSVLAAREAAQIAFFETKKFQQAIEFYLHLVKYSQDERERRDSQSKIATIYFDKLNDYPRAIEEFNKLLLLRNSNEEVAEYRFHLAKAHFNMNHFFEAETELQDALKVVENPDRKFDLLMFKGSLFFNTKRIDQAIDVYKELTLKYPERAKRENIAMNLIVCYEEKEAFDLAIQKLQEIKANYPDPEFIDLKTQRLKDRKANLPGSRGLRK
jgi:tetratricopeptide (TPR) repeat protein